MLHTVSEETPAIRKSRKKGVLKYDRNPFWDSTSIKTRGKRVTVEEGTYLNGEGEARDLAGIHVTQRLDRGEFVKVYTNELKHLLGLRPTALKVLVYMLHEVQNTPNSDSLYLAWQMAEKYFAEQEIRIGRTAYQAALLQLIQREVIAESTLPYYYWLNPRFYWNGDRYSFWRTYILES